jgi:GxxExxY protein
MSIERQKPLPLVYKNQRLDCGFRIDLLVEEAVVVEVKAIERFERVHVAQLMSYLKFADCRVGLLVNFNVALLARDGLKRVVNAFPE